ncbi:MAG: hypothetical protein A3F41_02470 [Coxiella sp. RIFCSPHIGHO2_12_FULL_44_14]|nr:MAG: hypothetical protein A3F41_02470 [Coxiella sp. RIFCSPHIGHO2_12_FULL_44_14]
MVEAQKALHNATMQCKKAVIDQQIAWAQQKRGLVIFIDVALEQVGLTTLQHRRMDQLSGDERARARLARMLAVQAYLLLADEPVAALDPFHLLNVMTPLHWQRDYGKTIIVVLHDLTLASRLCNRLLLMHQRHGIACDSPRIVLTSRNLQTVYQVQADLGEHQQQNFVLPWACTLLGQPKMEVLA